MNRWQLTNYLREHGGVYLGDCLIVLTSGLISDGYVNQRVLKDEEIHQDALSRIGQWIGEMAKKAGADMVVGPATMGAVFAKYAHKAAGIDYATIDLKASNPEWSQDIRGAKVLVVDDTLTTGKSVRLCVEKALADGATVVGAAVTIRRDVNVGDADCSLPDGSFLYVMEDIDFSITTQETDSSGNCPLLDSGLPMRTDIGHATKPHPKFGGKRWVDLHPNYPTVP
jgi:orotate phosphoribosyltransferase